jgi:hypothetical protein
VPGGLSAATTRVGLSLPGFGPNVCYECCQDLTCNGYLFIYYSYW